MGRSTPVKPSIRLAVWLETVPVLMRIIKAPHVFLAAHSCGVIYALNAVFHMPEILPPSHRKLYLFSPWVPTKYSGVTSLSISSHLPAALIGGFDSILRFVNRTIMPVTRFSGVVADSVTGPFSKSHGGEDDMPNNRKRFEKFRRDDLCREYCGASSAEIGAQSNAIMQRVFGESIRGASDEALLCLRKDVAGPWGACDDYARFPDSFETKLREQDPPAGTQYGDGTTGQGPFVIRVYWAEKDNMIGKKGGKYFDECFKQFSRLGPSSGDKPAMRLVYESETVPDTDHDTLCLPQNGAISLMMEDICKQPDVET
jgi:hypothetical protein